MIAVTEIPGREASWKRPNWRKREYEWRAGDEVVARMRWTRGSLAVAESTDGRWTLKRSGFLRPRVTVRVEGSETDLATFHASWDGGGTLEFRDGRRFEWNNTNLLHTNWVWTSPGGDPLLRFKGKTMTLEPAGLRTPAISLLGILSWYLNIMNNEDSGAASAVVVTAIG